MNACSLDIRSLLISQEFDEDGDWTIVVGMEQDKPNNMITVFDREGEVLQDHNRNLWRDERIQILIRGLNYDDTYAKMIAIQKYLILLSAFEYEGCSYKAFVSFGSPYFLGADDRRRFTWSMNFRVFREEKEISS